ncbi:MAG: SWIM zinc finger family protein [Dongiaceae bacterium]
MKVKNRPRFDIEALREIAGEKVFARGEAYHRDGLVQILSLEPGRVLAQVSGTEDYRTMVTGRGAEIGGECSCPAFEDWGFCTHMVAVALAATGAKGEAESTGALARIRDHLAARGVGALVDMIVDMAERDAVLFQRLDLAAATIDADDKMIEARLRKALDRATRTREFVDNRAASGWAAGVEGVLEAVAGLAAGERANLAIVLVVHAIDRINSAIENMDDSDGHCGGLLRRARDIHLAACRAAKPDPVKLARDLFAREMADEYGAFDRAANHYADVLAEAGLAEYRRLAVAAWEKLPARSGEARMRDQPLDNYGQLIDILDFFAERDGDIDARIALRAKNLSSPLDYLRLGEFCLANGREEEALRRAEEGLWVFEDGRPDERLVFFALKLLLKAGRKEDARALLQKSFQNAPSLELYTRLRKLGGAAARERAIKQLDARIGMEPPTQQRYLVDLLMRVLMHEKLFDAAWAAARKHETSMDVKEALARASEASHPDKALEAYAERVDQLAGLGDKRTYAQAAALVRRMADLRGPTKQGAYVTALKARFARKRNFMKLLG